MNVSAQPKLSPFRYPGGKTRLVELVHSWLLNCDKTETFIEPFAGGASVGLYVAAKGLAKRVRLIEIDPDVSCVWTTILSSDWKWLCHQISGLRPTRRRVMEILTSEYRRPREIAFRTLVRNRFGRSGLLWNGAGLVRVGERGVGLASRWYPETLVSRIKHINSMRDRISFMQGCGLDEIDRRAGNHRTALFVDPPYSINEDSAGTRLYRHNDLDHSRLFEALSNARARFLMTHEDNKAVRAYAKTSAMQLLRLPMLTAQKKRSAELLIGTDLEVLISKLRADRRLFSEPLSKLTFLA